MGNKLNIAEIKERKLFNEDDKKKFLSEMISDGSITEETSNNYERILYATYDLESVINKDLNRFNFEELETVLNNFNANNRNTIETYARIISSYLNWSVKEGFAEYNYLADLKPNDFSNYLKNEESYFSEKSLRKWEEKCENYQDAVIIRLLFLGAGGKTLSEIRNLKATDIDRDNNRIKLINSLKEDDEGNPLKFTERWLKIDDEYTFNLIEGAINQKTYSKRNGMMISNPHVRPFTDLVINKFVVRSSITKTDNFNNPVDKFVIYRRIDMIGDTLEIESFKAKFIQRSGMIAYANEIIQNGEVSLDDMKMVAGRYGMSSYHNLKGFLTMENILKTYPKT